MREQKGEVMKQSMNWLKKQCKVAVCLLFIGMLTGCGAKEKSQNNVPLPNASVLNEKQEGLDKLPEVIRQVLDGEGTFVDVEQKKAFSMETYRVQTEMGHTVQACWGKYIVSDIDGDGERELIVQIKNDEKEDAQDASVRVLDLQGDTVFCYCYPDGGIVHVYKDGVMEGSSVVGDNCFFTAEYSGMDYENIRVAECLSTCKDEKSRVEYYIGQSKVTEKEFKQFLNKYNEENRLRWMDSLVKR